MGICSSNADQVSDPAEKKLSPEEEKKIQEVAKQRRRLSVAPGQVGDISGQANVDAKVEEDDKEEDGHGGFVICHQRSKQGYVPYNSNKVNQDRAHVKYKVGGDPDISFFAVMDGHGEFGHRVSEFVKQHLERNLSDLGAKTIRDDPAAAMSRGVQLTVDQLKDSSINCAFSGTTLVFSLLIDRTLWVGNVGDSRCVLCARNGDKIKAIDLSHDQKPDNPEEKERILKAGGRVDTLPGPADEDCGPYRVWLFKVDVPGLAMSRSIGDDVSHTVGVISEPEVEAHDLKPDDLFVIWASDGVWEFISSEKACQIVAADVEKDDLATACAKLVKKSCEEWNNYEDVVDDITCVIVKFRH